MNNFENSENEDMIPGEEDDGVIMPEGTPGPLKDMVNDFLDKMGGTGGVAIPLGAIPKSLIEKICSLCPERKEEDVAELDMNQGDEWNSINAELDRLYKEQVKIDKAYIKVITRRDIFRGTLELQYDVLGENLKIENGALIRRFCGRDQETKCITDRL